MCVCVWIGGLAIGLLVRKEYMDGWMYHCYIYMVSMSYLKYALSPPLVEGGVTQCHHHRRRRRSRLRPLDSVFREAESQGTIINCHRRRPHRDS